MRAGIIDTKPGMLLDAQYGDTIGLTGSILGGGVAAGVLIIDGIAALQTVRVKDILDFIGGPFKYIEEILASIPVAYDLADFASEVSQN